MHEETWIAQMDVNNAFYRIRAPIGMEELFVLPAVRSDLLKKMGVGHPR